MTVGPKYRPRIWGTFFATLFVLGVAHAAIERVDGISPSIGRAPTGIGGGQANRQHAQIPATMPVAHGPTRLGTSVYPHQEIPIRFTHGQHLRLGLECATCHTGVTQSRRATDSNFPRGKVCDTCHGPQHPRPVEEPARCELCHTALDASKKRVTANLRAPAPMLQFNHKLHIDKGAACSVCHGDLSRVRLATTLQLPREADCLGCHDGVVATQRCAACHPANASGRLRTRVNNDEIQPALVPRGPSAWGAEHDLTFVEDHAGISKSNAKLCGACHDETFCIDCHAGGMRPLRIHAGDYVTTHGGDARARAQDCQSCHRTQSFCIGCHERLGFGDRDRGTFAVGGPLQFHPPGFSGPPGTPQTHARQARTNMAACASCHTEDSCLACHATAGAATAGLGVNPHGAGFAGSARCAALGQRNRRVCLKCHVPGDPQLGCI